MNKPVGQPNRQEPSASSSTPLAASRAKSRNAWPLALIGGVLAVCVCGALCLVVGVGVLGRTEITQAFQQGRLPFLPRGRVAPVVGKALVSQTISFSNQPQAVSWGNAITVTLPANVVDKPQTLTISAAANPPPSFSPSMQFMDIYDVKLGDQTQFAEPLTLELAFDPRKAASPEDVGLAYWDNEAQTWVVVPSQIDTRRNVVTSQARHLTAWVTFYMKIGWAVEKSSQHFAVVYKPGSTIAIKTPAKQVDAGVFAQDLAFWLDEAYTRYHAERGFNVPKEQRLWVFVGDTSSYWKTVEEAQRSTLLGNLLFTAKSDDLDTAQFDAAHELFHVVQSTYFFLPYHVVANPWYFDATADYAAGRIAQRHSDKMGKDIDAHYLDESITIQDSIHEYSTSHFFDYLVTQKGMDFKAMWDSVASPSIWDTGTILDPLDKFLKSKFGATKGLDVQYMQFAEFFIFDPVSPMPPANLKGENLAKQAGAKGCVTTFKADQTEATCTLILKPYYTSKLWGVVPIMTDGQSSRTLKVERIEGNAIASVYLLKGDKRTGPAAQSFAGGFSSGPLVVQVERGDGLYIQAYNTRSRAETVKFKITAEPLAAKPPPAAGKAPSPGGGCWVLETTKVDKSPDSARPSYRPFFDISNGSALVGAEVDSTDASTSNKCTYRRWSDHAWTPLPPMLTPGQILLTKLEVTISNSQSSQSCRGASVYPGPVDTTIIGADITKGAQTGPSTANHVEVTHEWQVPDGPGPSWQLGKLEPSIHVNGLSGGSGSFTYVYKWQDSGCAPRPEQPGLPTNTPTATVTRTPTATRTTPTATPRPSDSKAPCRPLASRSTSNGTIGTITFASGVTSDYKPIAPKTRFPERIGQVFGVYTYQGMREGTSVTREWCLSARLKRWQVSSIACCCSAYR